MLHLPDSSMGLTGDGHVHSEWSFDVGLGDPHSNAAGRMDSMCRRAVQIGLPALAFTEHLDITSWAIEPEDLPDRLRPLVGENGVLTPPLLDADGYLDSLERCRREFPELRILTGVEFGQPHLDEASARQVIDLDSLDRVNGSLPHHPYHRTSRARFDPSPTPSTCLWSVDDVVRSYLAEMMRMIAAGRDLCGGQPHRVRGQGTGRQSREGPFDPKRFEDDSDRPAGDRRHRRALELNTAGPIRPWIPQWWREEGGHAITIASDAHTPDWLAGNFYEAMARP